MKKPSGNIISKQKAMSLAAQWHSGQWSPLYSFASSGTYDDSKHDDYVRECVRGFALVSNSRQRTELSNLKKWFEYKHWELNSRLNGLGSLGDLSNEDKLKIMLETDKKTYESLATIRIFLSDPASKSNPNYTKIQASEVALSQRYNARQDDYKNNTAYKLGAAINEWSDGVTGWFKQTWENISSSGLWGLGAAPLVVPVAIAAGAVLTVSAVAYFVYSYYTETSVDYNEALKTVELLARHNPVLAEKMLDQISAVKQNEQETGLFNQAGVGLKYGLIAAGVGVAALATYGVGKKLKWF
jgi:hypothetical protein